MDSIDLLAREDEFKKLNKQLEKKTESLMREIELVMQKQDFFADFSHSLSNNTTRNIKPHCCDTPKDSTPEHTNNRPKFKKRTNKSPKLNSKKESEIEGDTKTCANEIEGDAKTCANENEGDQVNRTDVNDSTNCEKKIACACCTVPRNTNVDMEFLHAFVSVSVQEKVLPQSFLKDRVTVDSVCKFLSAKVKLMQEQMDKLQSVIDNKALQCKGHMTRQAELEGERMSLLNKTNNYKCVAADIKAKYAVLENKFSEKDKLYKEQRSEADKLSTEVKRLKCKNVSLEARCASQEETIDNLKHQVEIAKRAEKEFRDSSRSLSASHLNAISRLEARIKSLTSCIDKQAALIDNLRKQNAILSTDGAMKILEREYSNFLAQDL